MLNNNSDSGFYGCGSWSLTLRLEHRLRVFEIRVLKVVFGPKWDKVREEWRKLHCEELHISYYSSTKIIMQIKTRRIGWAGHGTRMGEERKVYKVLAGKRLLGRPRRRWNQNGSWGECLWV
jgi:hypothetical protein